MTNPIDSFLLSAVYFLIVVGVLVFIHELGHFLFAKFFGVGVETFSLGFGKKLFSRRRGETEYCVSAVPLGGYVKMVGEDPEAEVSSEDLPKSFMHKPVLQRMVIVAAGPVFNLLLAVLIFFAFFLSYGKPVLKPLVGKVSKGMPAEKAGIMEGDLITAVDGSHVETFYDLTKELALCNGKEIAIHVRRGEADLVFKIMPHAKPEKKFGAEFKRYLIGIEISGNGYLEPLNVFEALEASVSETIKTVKTILIVVGRLVTGEESSDNLGGPILIAKMAKHHAEKGVQELINFIAMVSVMLGILNLLPIPILDGGHLLFFSIEALIRRPVNARFREIAQICGFFILMMIMALAFYNDIAREFNS